MFSKIVVVALAAAATLVSAVPTRTNGSRASRTNQLTGVTHTVVAGRAGNFFDPDNVVAEIGDVIEWHYLPVNHSVVQSSFDAPCVPLAADAGFFSGFFPTQEGQSDEVFQVVVKDDRPVWYYCAQGTHCQGGMVGAVNQVFDSDKTLREFKVLAAAAGPGVAGPEIAGGSRIINPNPNAGV